MSIDVGARLKHVREVHGLSQRELARRAGVTNGLISLIEQNRVSPSVGSLKKVLDGVPLSMAEFRGRDGSLLTRAALDGIPISANSAKDATEGNERGDIPRIHYRIHRHVDASLRDERVLYAIADEAKLSRQPNQGRELADGSGSRGFDV